MQFLNAVHWVHSAPVFVEKDSGCKNSKEDGTRSTESAALILLEQNDVDNSMQRFC